MRNGASCSYRHACTFSASMAPICRGNAEGAPARGQPAEGGAHASARARLLSLPAPQSKNRCMSAFRRKCPPLRRRRARAPSAIASGRESAPCHHAARATASATGCGASHSHFVSVAAVPKQAPTQALPTGTQCTQRPQAYSPCCTHTPRSQVRRPRAVQQPGALPAPQAAQLRPALPRGGIGRAAQAT